MSHSVVDSGLSGHNTGLSRNVGNKVGLSGNIAGLSGTVGNNIGLSGTVGNIAGLSGNFGNALHCLNSSVLLWIKRCLIGVVSPYQNLSALWCQVLKM
jgi:hypothetical protein